MDYEFRFAADNFTDPLLPAFLVDAYTGTKTPLSVTGTTTVPFTVNAETGSSAPGRFKVVFGKPGFIPGVVTNGINIYPNPLKSNKVNVQINEPETGIYRLKLFNTAGQLVFTAELNHTAGSTIHALNLGDNVASGNYQLEIILPGKRRLARKLVIEK